MSRMMTSSDEGRYTFRFLNLPHSFRTGTPICARHFKQTPISHGHYTLAMRVLAFNSRVSYLPLHVFLYIVLQLRSEVIATYALCGFSNFGSIGILLGSLTAIAPERKGDIASLAVRALIAGTVACLMTACIAGMIDMFFVCIYLKLDL